MACTQLFALVVVVVVVVTVVVIVKDSYEVWLGEIVIVGLKVSGLVDWLIVFEFVSACNRNCVIIRMGFNSWLGC